MQSDLDKEIGTYRANYILPQQPGYKNRLLHSLNLESIQAVQASIEEQKSKRQERRSKDPFVKKLLKREVSISPKFEK